MHYIFFGSHIVKTCLLYSGRVLDIIILMLTFYLILSVSSLEWCFWEVIKAVFQQWSGMQPNVSSLSLIRPQDEQPSITAFPQSCITLPVSRTSPAIDYHTHLYLLLNNTQRFSVVKCYNAYQDKILCRK